MTTSLLSKFLNFLIPPQCPGCRDYTEQPHTLCAPCWEQVHFIQNPMCIRCGTPYPFIKEAIYSCENCETKNFAFDSAQSATVYDDFVKSLILRLKHGDATYLAPLFGLWLSKLPLPENCLLVPVPLHWTRLFKRQFNQAGLLALYLRKLKPNFFVNHPTVLQRVRVTKSQGTQSAQERFDNLDGAFFVHQKAKTFLEGKKIILIDDVLTSGATAHACAKTLKEAGCDSVHVLTIARVLKK